MNTEYREAVGEVLQVLKNTEESLVNKIPKKLLELWEKNAITHSELEIDTSKPIEEIKLSEKSKDLLGMIYRNYWCDSEQRKEYDEILRKNEEKFQEKARQTYNPENIFKTIETTSSITENIEESASNEINIIPYKESFLTKIIERIKIVFKR